MAMMMFKQGVWMFSFDLKSDYHHFDVVKCHRKYCTWVWKPLHISCAAIGIVFSTLYLHKDYATFGSVTR